MNLRLNGYSIVSMILCEQVRQEIRNKVSIIGVYSSNIIVGQFPSTFPLTIYLEIDVQVIGAMELNIRLVSPGPNMVEMKVVGDITMAGLSHVPIPTMALVCSEAGPVTVEVNDGGGVWHVLTTRKIDLGDIDEQVTAS